MDLGKFPPQNRATFPPAAAVVLATIALCLFATIGHAYDRYSQNRDATNCRACHGNFRASSYISLADGMDWGNLHDLHRLTMLNADCLTCHSATNFPVYTYQSSGGAGLAPISCVGCHGREEDNGPENPSSPHGYGAGLRRHHYTSGVTVCAQCHDDANPANYSPVGEPVMPPYYANPGADHPAMPTDPCNADGSEDFAGAASGLDNDGNDLYDLLDPQCGAAGIEDLVAAGDSRLRCYPNPSEGSISIEYEAMGAYSTEIRILDIVGRLVRNLGSSKAPSETQRVEWDGRDEAGRIMPTGFYVCELRSKDARSTVTMRLLR